MAMRGRFLAPIRDNRCHGSAAQEGLVLVFDHPFAAEPCGLRRRTTLNHPWPLARLTGDRGVPLSHKSSAPVSRGTGQFADTLDSSDHLK
jgi:hypothetical protein